MGNPAWIVKKVIPRKDYTLLLTFEDGKNGIYDFRPNLSRPIFKKQQNIDFFMQAKALYGTVVLEVLIFHSTCRLNSIK